MTNDEYLELQLHIALMELRVRRMPLAAFLERARHADTLGAVLDPTLYRAAAPTLSRIIRLAESLQDFQRVAQQLADETIAAGRDA